MVAIHERPHFLANGTANLDRPTITLILFGLDNVSGIVGRQLQDRMAIRA
jgi:hypothetical protein